MGSIPQLICELHEAALILVETPTWGYRYILPASQNRFFVCTALLVRLHHQLSHHHPSQALSAREFLPYDDISQAETKMRLSLQWLSEGSNFASLARDSFFYHPNLVFSTLSSRFASSPSFSSLSCSESDETDDEPVCLATIPSLHNSVSLLPSTPPHCHIDSIGGDSGCLPRSPSTDTPQS